MRFSGAMRTGFVLALVWSVVIGGCASSQSTEGEATSSPREQAQESRYHEIVPYLVDEDADAIVKFRMGDWEAIQPLVADLLASTAGGEAGPSRAEALVEASASGPGTFVRQLTGQELDLEHVDSDRPGYLVFQPYLHSAGQTCLRAGYPCVLFHDEGARYGRLLLPSSEPKELAEDLRTSLGDAGYRIARLEYHVRVEFTTAADPDDRVAAHLDRRVDDRPDDDFYGHRTPARQALLDHSRPFGVYLDLRAAIDAARFLELRGVAERLGAERMREAPDAKRMQVALAESAAIAKLGRLDMPDDAEFDDIAVTWRDHEAGETFEVVATHTRLRKSIHERDQGRTTELPDVEIEKPAAAAEWDLRRADATDATLEAGWLQEDSRDDTLADRLEDYGDWAWIGALRAPGAVGNSAALFVRRLQAGFDPSGIVAGRIKIDRPPSADASEWTGDDLPRGAAVLRVRTGTSEALIDGLERLADERESFAIETHRGDDKLTEVRIANGPALAEAFPDEQSTTEVERFRLEASKSATRRLVNLAERLPFVDQTPIVRRLLATIADRGGIEMVRNAEPTWTGFHIATGGPEAREPTVDTVDFKLRAPKADCLDRVAETNIGFYRRLLSDEAAVDDILERMEAYTERMHKRIDACEPQGEAETESNSWASDYLTAWQALAEYREGLKRADKRLEQLCKDGHSWACDPSSSGWPWRRP